jgi:hypothetical protein
LPKTEAGGRGEVGTGGGELAACLPSTEAIKGAGEGEQEGAWAPASLSTDVGPALKSPRRERWLAVNEEKAPGSSKEEPDPVPCSSEEGPRRAGGGGGRSIDCHVDGLFLLLLALRGLLPRLHSLASLEEVMLRQRLLEDLENKCEHNLLDLGDREGLGWGNKLEGAAHQVRVTLGDEFNPGNQTVTLCPLSRGDK